MSNELMQVKTALSAALAIITELVGETQDEIEDVIADEISKHTEGITITDLNRVCLKFRRLNPSQRRELIRTMIIGKKIRKEERFTTENSRKPATLLFAETY